MALQIFRLTGQLPARKQAHQHRDAQRSIPQPDRTGDAQAAFQVGPEAQIQAPAKGQCRSYNKNKCE